MLSATFDVLGPQGERAPDESVLDHLIRIRWVKDERGLTLTQLGLAMLAEARHVKRAEESTVIVLETTDRFAYARLVGQIASIGSALLVDPYFRLRELETILDNTEVNRVLISKQYKGSSEARAELRTALNAVAAVVDMEIRATASSTLHDRILVSDEGPVYMLGASLNTVGVANTVFMRIPDSAAAALRAQAEDLWDAADAVGSASLVAPTEPSALAEIRAAGDQSVSVTQA
ncbi:hypothetical protein [Dactylosporangium sp. NPDC005555]|uniref:hypothetical protein n=1 Tax=Dactylosporangium sp. NPDC005555 TaxID=3154889 RepID=UPI0033B10854